MIDALSQSLPFAVAMALSPIPIISVIVVLFSARARSDGLAFVAGWMLGLAVIGALILVIAEATGVLTSTTGSSTTLPGVRLALGLLLLVAAVRKWRARPAAGEAGEMPAWMKSLDSMTPARSFVTASLLSGINPKNLMLNLAAMVTIAEANLPADEQLLVLGAVVLVASSTIIAPVMVYLVKGAAAAETLSEWKEWLITHNSAVMAVVLLVFGVILVGQGASGLAGA